MFCIALRQLGLIFTTFIYDLNILAHSFAKMEESKEQYALLVVQK
jgi:hypothetical protein